MTLLSFYDIDWCWGQIERNQMMIDKPSYVTDTENIAQ